MNDDDDYDDVGGQRMCVHVERKQAHFFLILVFDS